MPVCDVYSLLRNVEPGTRVAAEVQYVKTLEAVVLELSVFGSQSHSLDLQSEAVEVDVA